MNARKLGAAGLLAATIIVGCGGDTTTTVVETTTEETTSTTTTTAEQTESVDTTATAVPPEPTETTAESAVPDVVGLLAPDAKLALKEAGFDLFANTGSFARQTLDPGGPKERVCAQSPQAGTAAAAGSRVRIVIREKCDQFGQ